MQNVPGRRSSPELTYYAKYRYNIVRVIVVVAYGGRGTLNQVAISFSLFYIKLFA